jgi:hypothetical protein
VSQTTRTAFPRRQNPDGSFESICSQCFVTVATSLIEARLQRAESEHECKGFDLRRMYWTEHERQPNRERRAPWLDSEQA